jgi:DNA-directed RNA polymerase subunit H (RpoH/RPB5)
MMPDVSPQQKPGLIEEEMPTAYEKEDPELLELLRKHSNRPKGQTSGPCLRSVKAVNGEVVEVFPVQKSWDQIR